MEKTTYKILQLPISFYEAAKEYIGYVDGCLGDLATNQDYLRNSRNHLFYGETR